MSRARLEGFGFATAAFLNSIWIFYIYLSITLIGAFDPASLARVIETTAERPFIYRILVPILARSLAGMVPTELTEWLKDAPDALSKTYLRLGYNGYSREAVIVLILMFLSLTGFAFLEKTFLADLGYDKKERFVMPLVFQMFVLPVNLFTGFYYDLPQLFLMTICLIYLHRRNWTKYLIFLSIANFNKETSAFLILVYIAYYWSRLPRKNFFTMLIWQVALIGVIRGLLIILFRNNGGSFLAYTIPNQIRIYGEHPLALIFTIAYFGLVIFLTLRQWRSKNGFLRAASVIGLIILILFIPSGYPLEFRVFLDALPVLAILIFPPPPANSLSMA
jgi:hypothetical protein